MSGDFKKVLGDASAAFRPLDKSIESLENTGNKASSSLNRLKVAAGKGLTKAFDSLREKVGPVIKNLIDLELIGSGDVKIFNFLTGAASAGIKNIGAGIKNIGPGLKNLGFGGAGAVKIFENIGEESNTAFKSFDQLNIVSRGIISTFKGFISLGKTVGAVFAGIAIKAAKVAAAVAVIGTAVVAKSLISNFISIEKKMVVLEGLSSRLGVSGTEAFKKISDLAIRSSFSVETLTAAVIKFSASLKLNADDSLAVTKILASAAAATGATADEVDRAALALSQIGTRGRLASQEINQITQSLPGVSRVAIFENIAKEMNVLGNTSVNTTASVQKLADQGLIPAGIAIKSILQVMKEVPGAAGALDRQAATLGGTFERLKGGGR